MRYTPRPAGSRIATHPQITACRITTLTQIARIRRNNLHSGRVLQESRRRGAQWPLGHHRQVHPARGQHKPEDSALSSDAAACKLAAKPAGSNVTPRHERRRHLRGFPQLNACAFCTPHSRLHAPLTLHPQRDALGRSAIDFAAFLQKPDLALLMQQLSLQLFAAAIAAASRFSFLNYGQSACGATSFISRHSRALPSHSAVRTLLFHTKRSMTCGNRSRVASWSALASVLAYRLSFESDSGAAPSLTFHRRVHHLMLAAKSRGNPVLRLQANENAAVINAK